MHATNDMKISLHAADATGQPTGADLLTGKLKAAAQLDGAFFGTATPANPVAPGPMLLSIKERHPGRRGQDGHRR